VAARYLRFLTSPTLFIKILPRGLAGWHQLICIILHHVRYETCGVGGDVPQFPRKYARVKPAGLVSRQAKIITDPRAPVIPCTLIDYSPGGACVDLGGQVKIPDRFELLHVNTKKRCRIAWKRGTRVGVVF
jgi:hypothetical protein